MSWLNKHATTVRLAGVIVVGALATTGCASTSYVKNQIATVNTRIDALDQRITTVSQRADAAEADAQKASQAASAANSAAQGAATDAQSANQRLDQLSGRVDVLENPPANTRKRPRG
jgi:outer membrane murein-binding lipoprotein Lpp